MEHERRYFSLNRMLLRIVGLWPYQRTKLIQFQSIFLLSIMITNIIFQFTKLLTSELTTEIIVKVFSSALFSISCVVTYNMFYVNFGIVRCLLQQVQHISEELKDDNEIAIIENYYFRGKQYTAGLLSKITFFVSFFFVFNPTIVLCMCGALLFNFIIFQPYIFNVISFRNESRIYRSTPIETEYFIDQKKYFYLILLHINAAIFVEISAMLATGTMFIAWNQHGCGMFKIASHRVEHAMRTDVLQNIDRKNERLIYTSLIYAVDMHCKAMQFFKLQLTGFVASFLSLIIIVVPSSSFNLYLTVLSGHNIEEIILPFFFLSCHYMSIFITNYIDQDVLDHSNYIFMTAYNVPWYKTSSRIQKMILFILQRRSQAFTMNIGGIFVASLEGFATLIKASVSYFTVLYSVR